MEVRLRTLEAQRDTDHEHFMKLTQFVESLNTEFIKHQTAAHEMQQQLREFTVSGVRFARNLAEITDSTNLRFKNIESEFPDIIIGVVDAQVTAAIEKTISTTQSAFLTLEAKLCEVFAVTKAERASDQM